jgi:hypothetical protein
MKTVPFSTILAEVCQLIGLDRTTLNDKGFSTIRDFANRRIGIIWDREEWPDIQTYYKTWPGTPITTVTVDPIELLTEAGNELWTENGDPLYEQNAEDTIPLVLALNTDHVRVYLQDFDGELFQQGGIGSTTVSIINPFYILTDDGDLVSSAANDYSSFTYTTSSDDVGDYITSITIQVPWGTPQIQGSFGPQSTVIFGKNKQCVVVVQGQTIGAYSNDPRKTTKIAEEPYIIENFPDLKTGNLFSNNDMFILRFSNSGMKYILVRAVQPWVFGSKYDSGLAYSVGSQVYWDNTQQSSGYIPSDKKLGTTGNFWNCVSAAGVGVSPNNNSQYWKQVEIPMRFKDYLVNGIAADFMRSEGRAEEAMPLDQLAEMAVQQQIDVLIRQQGQTQRMNMAYTY